MRRGAVFQSHGERYTDQAAASARAAKKTNPWLGTALFTDDVDYATSRYSDAFDVIEPLVIDDASASLLNMLRERKWLFAIKLMVSYRSPFEQTLLIDSDTVIIKDISPAFDLLADFDLMLCHEVEHRFTEAQGYFGLSDDRRRHFYNSGVIFYNSTNAHVVDFLKKWEDIQRNGDEVLQRSDQDSLNHMIALPVEYMANIRFSGTVLKAREYNAFCRYWREIWDAGHFADVRIVHTFLSKEIADTVASTGAFDWRHRIEEASGEIGEYLNRFTSSLTPKEKRRFADVIKDRTVSIRQFKDYAKNARGHSKAEDLSFLFSTTVDYSGFNLVSTLHRLEQANILPPNSKITQIGMQTDNPYLPLHNGAETFVPGNDLEYLSELFDASEVTGISRSAFLGFKGRGIKTSRAEYALHGSLQGALEPGQHLIVDIDNSISPPTRIHNAVAAKKFLDPDGIYVICNVDPDVARRMGERLARHFSVSVEAGTLLLRHQNVAVPSIVTDYTPFSTARIGLIGNCQSSALASFLHRVKGVKLQFIVDINGEGSESYQHAHYAAAHGDIVDFCFSQPLGENFGDIRSVRLRKKYGSRFKQYTNLYFTGYHPDLTYFGGRGVRVQSAMGDYNSRIALIGYTKGLTIDETVALFNEENYRRLNYFSQFEGSKAELLRRDEENDVRFAGEFFEIARDHVPLYTVNHPTAHALAPLASLIAEAAGQGRPSINVNNIRNPLVENSIWPVYPEVAAALGLHYPGDTTFYASYQEDRPPMSLRDFVGISFDRYDEFGRSNLMGIPGAEDLSHIEL